jgi:hypothetical protein
MKLLSRVAARRMIIADRFTQLDYLAAVANPTLLRLVLDKRLTRYFYARRIKINSAERMFKLTF